MDPQFSHLCLSLMLSVPHPSWASWLWKWDSLLAVHNSLDCNKSVLFICTE